MINDLANWAASKRPRTPSAASMLLLAGCALAAVGLARDPQGSTTPPHTQVIPMIGGGATADSNGRMIAVTGTDVTGTSLLYLVDTEKMRLVVYQANGGSESTQGVRFIGARRIDLDLELDGFNDKSEFPYKKLKEEFSKKGLIKGDAAPAAANPQQQEH